MSSTSSSGLDQGVLSRVRDRLESIDSKPVDPSVWAAQKAGVELWSAQRDIAESVQENKKTAVRAGHGVGKSLAVSAIAAWWIDIHPPGEAFVVTTAPSAPQVHAILWENIRNIHAKGDLPGTVQMSDNWVIGKTLVGYGRKPHDHSKHAFQGIHRRYVLVILDEACGIPQWLWTAAESITTNENSRLLAIGNPDDPSSEFAKVCKPGSTWNRLKISVFDSPNFTGEKVSRRAAEELTSTEWVEDKRTAWGEDNPLWRSKIEGEFPELDEYAVIPMAWINAAVDRWRDWFDSTDTSVRAERLVLGVDVARFGLDKTVFAHRRGRVITGIEDFAKLDTETTADLVSTRVESEADYNVVVDVIGIGAGVVDKLKRKKYRVETFNAASRTSAVDSTREWGFPTLRSAAWWRMREALDPSKGSDVCLPPDENLAADLISPRWSPMTGAKIYVESKDDIRKRLGRSTDYADAVIQAMWASGGPPLDVDDASFAWTDNGMADGALEWDEPDIDAVLYG